MSTLSGIFPNALTPTMSPLADPAVKAQQRREADAAVFSPVEESQASSASQERTNDRPGRDDSQRQAYEALGRPGLRQNEDKTSAQSSDQAVTPAEQPDDKAAANQDEPQGAAAQTSAFQEQHSENRETRKQAEQAQEEKDLEAIRELARRDREVRAHEQAHQAVGGRYAGAMSLTFEQGPDGKRYAVAGEVSINASRVPDDPRATLEKASQIRRAALAPAEPSPQDRAVAAQASQMILEAQTELRQQELEQSAGQESESESETETETEESSEISQESRERAEAASEQDAEDSERSREDNRERRNNLFAQTEDILDRTVGAEQYRDQVNPVGSALNLMV